MTKYREFLGMKEMVEGYFRTHIYILSGVLFRKNMNNYRIYLSKEKCRNVPLKGRFLALKMSQTASLFNAFAPNPYTVSNRMMYSIQSFTCWKSD